MTKLHAVKVNEDAPNEQWVIVIHKKHYASTLEVLKFVSKDSMRRQGLVDTTTSSKMLIDMADVARGLARTLNTFIQIDHFNHINWRNTFDLYAPFIDKMLKWERVDEFINPQNGKGDWM